MTPEIDPADVRRAKFFHQLLYETPGGIRFTQDSPVLTNVWLAYADAPRRQQKLILTLDRLERAGSAASELRTMLASMRRRLAGLDGDELDLGLTAEERRLPKIAYIPGQISAELYFDEMMRLVLPLTPWWRETHNRLRHATNNARDAANAASWDGFPMPDDAREEDIVDGLYLVRREMLDEIGSTEAADEQGIKEDRRRYLRRMPVDFFWIVRLVGTVGHAFLNGMKTIEIPEIDRDELREALADDGRGLSPAELLARDFKRRFEVKHGRLPEQVLRDAGPELKVLRRKTGQFIC